MYTIVYIMRVHRPSLPIPVSRALRFLATDLGDARRRRRIPGAVLAERARISRQTLVKIEKGDPTVAFGSYATVLFALGMVDRLTTLAAPEHDAVGLALEAERLPRRIHLPRASPPMPPERA